MHLAFNQLVFSELELKTSVCQDGSQTVPYFNCKEVNRSRDSYYVSLCGAKIRSSHQNK